MSDACSTLQGVCVRFMLEADPSPGLLPRLLAPFARRDLTPHRMWSHLSHDSMHVEIALEAAPETDVAMVAGNLSQVIGVRSVVQVRGNSIVPMPGNSGQRAA